MFRMMVDRRRIVALCAICAGLLLLAAGGPSISSASPPAQETFTGSTEPVEAPVPAGLPLGGVVLHDVRIAAHDTFDRITFQFDGGLPGYNVRYVEPPILLDPSGMEVAVEGSAFIQIVMQQARAQYLVDAPTFTQQEFKPGLKSIIEAQQTGDFEAVLIWVLGVSDRLPFRVQTFQGPDRLAVDVGHAVQPAQPAGVPQTGDGSAPDASSWPLGAVAAGTLALLLGAAAAAVALKRR